MSSEGLKFSDLIPIENLLKCLKCTMNLSLTMQSNKHPSDKCTGKIKVKVMSPKWKWSSKVILLQNYTSTTKQIYTTAQLKLLLIKYSDWFVAWEEIWILRHEKERRRVEEKTAMVTRERSELHSWTASERNRQPCFHFFLAGRKHFRRFDIQL